MTGTFDLNPVVTKQTGGAYEADWFDELADVWYSMSTNMESAYQGVSKSVSDTIDTVASAPSRAIQAVKDTISDTATGVTDAVGGVMSAVQNKILIGVGVVLLLLIVLGKSGVLRDSASIVRAVYGGK